jgi:hypothetical protein
MDKRIVVIVKAPSDNDMFFDNHTILIRGRIPGGNEESWYQQNVDYLPTSVLINVPDDVHGVFHIKFVIEDKLNSVAVFESSEPLYLTIRTMQNRFKFVELARK